MVDPRARPSSYRPPVAREQCSNDDEVLDPGDLIAELTDRAPWMKDALCKSHPAVNFFPDKGERTTA